jgi:hypothetical protein
MKIDKLTDGQCFDFYQLKENEKVVSITATLKTDLVTLPY